MGFSYQVLSEEQANAERYQLLKEGEYNAVIKASVDATSSTGNPMMDMTLAVYDENGRSCDVRDFMVFTPKMMWKVIHFAESAGLLKEYEAGKLCSQFVVNANVKVKIGIDEGKEIPQEYLKGKPLGSKYPDKNKIIDYLKHDNNNAQQSNKEDELDSDIPF